MKVSFQGIGRQIITTKAASSIRKGDLCYFNASMTVAPASGGRAFSGKVLQVYADGTASVQIHGYIEVQYQSTAPITGTDLQSISCETATSVKADANGRKYLVVSLDTTKKTVGILL